MSWHRFANLFVKTIQRVSCIRSVGILERKSLDFVTRIAHNCSRQLRCWPVISAFEKKKISHFHNSTRIEHQKFKARFGGPWQPQHCSLSRSSYHDLQQVLSTSEPGSLDVLMHSGRKMTLVANCNLLNRRHCSTDLPIV